MGEVASHCLDLSTPLGPLLSHALHAPCVQISASDAWRTPDHGIIAPPKPAEQDWITPASARTP